MTLTDVYSLLHSIRNKVLTIVVNETNVGHVRGAMYLGRDFFGAAVQSMIWQSLKVKNVRPQLRITF